MLAFVEFPARAAQQAAEAGGRELQSIGPLQPDTMHGRIIGGRSLAAIRWAAYKASPRAIRQRTVDRTMTTAHEGTRLSADEALERLIEGNQRFLRGDARGSAFRRETRSDLAKSQRPFATVLGCSDSRVPPEWIFDTGLGELFVIRVAGNVLSPEIAGTLQYAGSYLETPLFVILGHEACGAINAALATKHEGTQFRSRVQLLLASILPGLPDFDPMVSPEEHASRAVESNVRWTLRQILDSPEWEARMVEGRMKLVGAIYEIETGRVRILPPDATR